MIFLWAMSRSKSFKYNMFKRILTITICLLIPSNQLACKPTSASCFQILIKLIQLSHSLIILVMASMVPVIFWQNDWSKIHWQLRKLLLESAYLIFLPSSVVFLLLSGTYVTIRWKSFKTSVFKIVWWKNFTLFDKIRIILIRLLT